MLLCRGSRHRGCRGDDVDDAAYRLAAIQGRTGAGEHLDTLHVGHIDARIAVIARQSLTVLQYQDIVLVQAVHHHRRTHAVGHRGDARSQLLQGILKVCDLHPLKLLRGDDLNGHNGIAGPVVRARTRHNDL